MAVLTGPERVKVGGFFQQPQQNVGFIAGVTKADIQAAVAAADDWADTNASAYNTALPVAFRNNASLQQKTMLLVWVVARRAGILKVEGE